MFFQKWCLSLLSIVMMKLQGVEVDENAHTVSFGLVTVPRGTFGLWAFRKYIHLCVPNVHTEKYAPLKQNRCIFLYILVWNIFSELFVTCGLLLNSFVIQCTLSRLKGKNHKRKQNTLNVTSRNQEQNRGNYKCTWPCVWVLLYIRLFPNSLSITGNWYVNLILQILGVMI